MTVKRKTRAFDLEKFLATVDGGGTIKAYAKGDAVFAQGGAADAVFYILKGRVKLAVASPVGKEAVVAILGERDFFGEGCLIDEPLRLATAEAMKDCAITRLPKALMIRTLRNERKFADMFLAHLLTRVSRLEEDLADQLFSSSERRLARILLLLANGKTGTAGHPVDINQETLAAMVGTTRPRVNYFMNKFRKQGFVDYNGTISVRSSLNAVLQD